MRDDGAITGYWTLPEIDGGCSNCHQRLMRVGRIEIDVFIFRLCDDCARALHALLDSMLDE